MANLPVTGYLENAARTEGEMKDALEDIRDKLSQQIGTDTASAVTISGGTFAPATRDTGGVFIVDTEGAASADDLNTIATTNVEDGSFIYVFAANASRVVTVKNSAGGSGQILLLDGADFTLDDLDKWVLLRLDGTEWKEVSRGFATDRQAMQSFYAIPISLSGSKLTPHENLMITRPTVATVTITADSALLRNANGYEKLFSSVSVTPNLTVSGAGGLDTGTEAADAWYHLWVIGQSGGIISAVFSTSSSAPTLPGGYTFYGYVGAIYNDSSSDLVWISQNGAKTLTAQQTALSSGGQTSSTNLSLSSIIPATAKAVLGFADVRETSSSSSILSIRNDSSDTNNQLRIRNPGGNTNEVGGQIRVLLHTTAQRIAYNVNGSNNRASIYITGWEY